MKPELIFLGAGVVIVGVLAWSLFDAGVELGAKRNAHVLQCAGGGKTTKHNCVVNFDGTEEQAVVYLPSKKAGDNVTLSIMQRPLSGVRYYVLVN